MTDPREEVLRRVFSAATQGRAAEVADLLDPEMEFISVLAGRTFVGVEGLEEWWNDVRGYYDDLRWEILDVSAIGEQLAVRWRFVGTSRGTGLEFDTVMSQLWTFRDGKVSRIEVFPDPESAGFAARS